MRSVAKSEPSVSAVSSNCGNRAADRYASLTRIGRSSMHRSLRSSTTSESLGSPNASDTSCGAAHVLQRIVRLTKRAPLRNWLDRLSSSLRRASSTYEPSATNVPRPRSRCSQPRLSSSLVARFAVGLETLKADAMAFSAGKRSPDSRCLSNVNRSSRRNSW